MKDLISRQAAIENSFEVYTKEYGWCEVVGVDVISELPSAQPERKTGRWIEKEGTWYCSECDEENAYAIDERTGLLWDNFCPKCGSYNGGEE